MVCLESGHLRVLPLQDIHDPDAGRTRVRLVDVQTEHYKVAREYMIRLERADMEDEDMQAKLAEAAKTTPEEFKKRFATLPGISHHSSRRI